VGLSPGGLAYASEPLIAAVKAGDEVAIRQLAKSPAAVNVAEVDGTTALHWAVRGDDAEAVRLLLRAGANVTAANRYGVTPLMLAVENGNVALVDSFLEAGADPNTTLPEGETVLMTAARTGRADVITRLLEAGANPEARESFHGETPLIWAVAENHTDAVNALIAGGADVNGRSRLESFARRGQGLTILSLGHWTPLMYAAREGALDAAAALADAGADLNLTDPDGSTALVLAIINLKFNVANLLVGKGADPNMADVSGMAALYAAVDMNTITWTFGLPEPKASEGLTALDLVKMLLAHGANPNARLKTTLLQRLHTTGDEAIGEGSTPFMRAAKSGDIAVMRLLLARGADPKAAAKNGTNALMLAAGLGWRDGNAAIPTRDRGTEAEAIDAITLCLDQGLDINATNDRGDTALHASVAGRGADDIVRFLVKKGAAIDAKNKQGRTPLDVALASRKDRSSNAALLRELVAGSAPHQTNP
jgi:ankyrin repeat protein